MKKALLKSIQILVILSLFFAVGCKKEKNDSVPDVKVTSVTLGVENITIAVEETATLTATIIPEDATNKTVIWLSTKTNVATVDNGIVTAKEKGTTTIIATTQDGNFQATCEVTVNPAWIEIKDIKWATRNVGAPGTFAANPEDAGMFYQWNRKIGWSSSGSLVNHTGGKTWDNTVSELDSCWEKDNDPCPQGWRVPTRAELISLISSGTAETTLNTVHGRNFGTFDGNTVFFPAAGHRDSNDGTLYVGSSIAYWSGSKSDHLEKYAYHMLYQGTNAGTYHSLRSCGFSVRCVKDE